MTFKEYFTQTHENLKNIPDLQKKLRVIYSAPNSAWIPGYKENQKTREDLRVYETCCRCSEEELDYYCGNKLASLEDIKQNRLAAVRDCLPDMTEPIDLDRWTEDMRDSGYAGYDELKNIERYWETLTSDGVLQVYSGDDDDYNLSGHRHYLLSGSLFDALMYNYAKYTLKKNKKDLDDNLCNSNDLLDNYHSLEVPEGVAIYTEEKLLAALEIAQAMTNSRDIERFNSMIDDIKECFGENSYFKAKVESIEAQKITT